MSNYWDKKYIGIAQPLMADVYILNVSFDFSISGRDWGMMTTEEKVCEFRRKLLTAINPALDEIENQVKQYEGYKRGPKEEK